MLKLGDTSLSSRVPRRNGKSSGCLKMSFIRLEHWVAKVILFILYLDCLACGTNLPPQQFIGVRERDITIFHRRRFHQEDQAFPRRSYKSYLEVNPSQVNGTTEAEFLLDFQNGVTRDPFNVLSSWNPNNISNYCNWTGVQCSSKIGEVSALNLSGYQLEGTLSPLLGGLQFLSSLDLSHNFFHGGIPTSIANCSKLSVLDLSENKVTGNIPLELNALSNLQELNLSGNALTGSFPPSRSNLSALRILDMANNQLDGVIMAWPWGDFGHLEWLDFSNNRISGAIPESLSNCSNLLHLDLSENNFTGSITDIFDKLRSLQWLDLSGNVFNGSIPLSLGTLKTLRVLSLHSNLLSGRIPMELGNLQNLTILHLGTNYLAGSIPASLVSCSSLTGMYLYDNQLTGQIPIDIGVLSQLQEIYLGLNRLTGSIPPSLLNCTSLIDIIFSSNFFGGEIPLALGTLGILERLHLHVNNFGGGIPASLGNISTLQEVLLERNQLIGEIPRELGLLQTLSLLDLSSNFLVGQIPPGLGNSAALIFLSLARNQLTDAIPPSIGELANVQILNLSDNILTGPIPDEISNCTQLSLLDLSGNYLSGSVPNNLGSLTALNLLYLNNNRFTGSLSAAIRQKSTSLIEINLAYNSLSGVIAGYDFGPLRNLQVSLDLSHNLFSGPLPPGIGALEFVQNINLSFNSFSGPITGSLSRCTGLQSLDLSSNNLDGQIPQSLITLQHLAYFNVSFNHLTGSVPNSGPFANFNNESFLGNPDLCGSVLPNKCKSSCRGIGCHHRWIVIIPAVAAGIAGVLALAGIWFLFIAKIRDSSGIVAPAVPNASHFTSELEGLSVGDIVAATNGFSDGSVMGVGSKSTVFAGVLPSGVMIAVKRLDLRNDDRATAQLYRELQRLSKEEHPNLLKVHGVFSAGDLKLLVLEYMPNGSLHKQMYQGEKCALTWAQRLNIALGIAEAMVHLHRARSKPIIHLDLKPSNILLDSNMEPKVSDYGISRYINHESHVDTTISTNLYGTIGYIPPEYGALTSVSTMGDVYNFGVVLMELVTRKQPTDDMFGQEVSLRSWVVDAFPSRISQILDSTLHQELAQNEQDVGIHLMVRLAIACTRNAPKDRPTMTEARDTLMEIKSIEQPYKDSQ